jgi:hypothetical protein
MQVNDHGIVTPRCWLTPRRAATQSAPVRLGAAGLLGRLACASALLPHPKGARGEATTLCGQAVASLRIFCNGRCNARGQIALP